MTVTDMPLAAFGGETNLRRVATKGRNKPRRDNGESRLLALLGAGWQYEPWQYPLVSCLPFTPDFWLPGTASEPELHVELTWLDWAITRAERRLEDTSGSSGSARAKRKRLAVELCELQQRWDRKQLKVSETNRLYGPIYGLEVTLLTREQADKLMSGAAQLADLRSPVLRRAS